MQQKALIITLSSLLGIALLVIAFKFGAKSSAKDQPRDQSSEIPVKDFSTSASDTYKSSDTKEPTKKVEAVIDDNSKISIPKKTKKPSKKPTKKPTKQTGNKSNAPKKPIGTFRKSKPVSVYLDSKLKNRGAILSSTPQNYTEYKGSVAVYVCVNRLGKVKESKFIEYNSTTKEAKLVSLAINAARDYRFTNSLNKEDCGKIIFTFL